jgi:hypothetical protein
MNTTPQHIADLIADHVQDIAAHAFAGLEACAKTDRKAVVTVKITIGRDREAPHVAEMKLAISTKTPKGGNADLSKRCEAVPLGRWDVEEEGGQERIPAT